MKCKPLIACRSYTHFSLQHHFKISLQTTSSIYLCQSSGGSQTCHTKKKKKKKRGKKKRKKKRRRNNYPPSLFLEPGTLDSAYHSTILASTYSRSKITIKTPSPRDIETSETIAAMSPLARVQANLPRCSLDTWQGSRTAILKNLLHVVGKGSRPLYLRYLHEVCR